MMKLGHESSRARRAPLVSKTRTVDCASPFLAPALSKAAHAARKLSVAATNVSWFSSPVNIVGGVGDKADFRKENKRPDNELPCDQSAKRSGFEMREIDYELCDVFTDRPLAGNALAVFTAADNLDDATMQALARETNLSESAFVRRPANAEADAAVRIFTPTMELPFAGHPTLGTAFVLAARTDRRIIKLETGRGLITVRLNDEPARPRFGWMTQPVPRIERYAHTALLLSALGVS